MPDTRISPGRMIAFDILLRVATQDAYAGELLRARLDSFTAENDAGLATELTLGVLRWQRLLDYAAAHLVTKTSATLDLEVRIALRLGMYQLAFLRVPPHAAVDESVELVKRARKRSAAPFVNAVIRRYAKQFAGAASTPESAFTSLLEPNLPPTRRLALLHSHPDWLVERWWQAFGDMRTTALLAANNSVPAISCLILDPQNRELATASLAKAGCSVEPGRLMRGALRLRGGNPSASQAVRNGLVSIQDEASQAVAHLVEVQPGDTVLDLCAAPGGKTLLLAKAAGAQGRVLAADLHEHRVTAMAERFRRAGAANIESLLLDGTQPLPFELHQGRLFNRILLDAPCAGTGTLARHPEIRWRLTPEDLPKLHARQVRLLRNALTYLAPRGRLVYATCSLEPEENHLVVQEALRDSGGKVRAIPPSSCLQPLLAEGVRAADLIATDGAFRTYPPDYGTDGFYAAVLEGTGG